MSHLAGKVDYYTHLYEEISAGDEKKGQDLDADREIQMKTAVVIHQIEESVMERVKSLLKAKGII